MKTTVKFAGILLLLIMAGNTTINAQRGMRGTMDSTHMNRMKMRADTTYRHGYGEMYNFRGPRNMKPGMGMGMGMGRMQGYGQFAGRGMMNGPGRGMGPEGRMGRDPGTFMLESIPNVTEKQKNDISDLIVKQREEIKKFMDETATKMQAMRDAHKKSVMNILTEEQKKYIESKQQKQVAVPAKTK